MHSWRVLQLPSRRGDLFAREELRHFRELRGEWFQFQDSNSRRLELHDLRLFGSRGNQKKSAIFQQVVPATDFDTGKASFIGCLALPAQLLTVRQGIIGGGSARALLAMFPGADIRPDGATLTHQLNAEIVKGIGGAGSNRPFPDEKRGVVRAS